MTFSSFQTLTAADLNAEVFRPIAVAENSTFASVPDSTTTALTMDTQVWDSDAMFTPGTNSFTVPSGKGGLYLFQVWVKFFYSASGRRSIDLFKNGSLVNNCIVQPPSAGAGEADIIASMRLVLAAGDVMALSGWQNSGGSLGVRVVNATLEMLRPS